MTRLSIVWLTLTIGAALCAEAPADELAEKIAVLEKLVAARAANAEAVGPVQGTVEVEESVRVGLLERTIKRSIAFTLDAGSNSGRWSVKSTVTQMKDGQPVSTTETIESVLAEGKVRITRARPGARDVVQTVESRQSTPARRFELLGQWPFAPVDTMGPRLAGILAEAKKGVDPAMGVTVAGTSVKLTTMPQHRWMETFHFDLAKGGQLVVHQGYPLAEGSHRMGEPPTRKDNIDLHFTYVQVGKAWVVQSWDYSNHRNAAPPMNVDTVTRAAGAAKVEAIKPADAAKAIQPPAPAEPAPEG